MARLISLRLSLFVYSLQCRQFITMSSFRVAIQVCAKFGLFRSRKLVQSENRKPIVGETRADRGNFNAIGRVGRQREYDRRLASPKGPTNRTRRRLRDRHAPASKSTRVHRQRLGEPVMLAVRNPAAQRGVAQRRYARRQHGYARRHQGLCSPPVSGLSRVCDFAQRLHQLRRTGRWRSR